MADPSHAADTGLLSNIVTQIGTGTAGAIVIWRVLVAFGRQDRAARMEAELREALRQQIGELREQVQRLTTDIASMAHERNEAVMERGSLETELRLIKERLEGTRKERDDARGAVARLQAELEVSNTTNQRLTEEAYAAEATRRNPGPPCGAAPAAQPAANRPAPRAVPGEKPWPRQ